MEAAGFIRIWKLFTVELLQRPDWQQAWTRDGEWSRFILGTKRSSSCDSTFGNFLISHSDSPMEWRYRTEDGLSDLAFTKQANFRPLPTLDDGHQLATHELGHEMMFPVRYDIIMEHENAIYSCWEEVTKLSYVHAPLKVLVTYTWDHQKRSKALAEVEMVERIASQVLSESSSVLGYKTGSEFLLIVGSRTEIGIDWYFRALEETGRVKIEDLFSL